jgi:hypothetical protein
MDPCRARRRWAALGLSTLVLVVAVATACGPAGTGAGGAGGAGGNASTPPRSGVLVTYRVSGGFAGVDERLVVSRDGTVVYTSGQAPPERGRLTADERAALVEALEASDFATLPRDTVDPHVADAFVYEVTYAGRRVRTSDGAIPPRLAPVLDLLREIAAR